VRGGRARAPARRRPVLLAGARGRRAAAAPRALGAPAPLPLAQQGGLQDRAALVTAALCLRRCCAMRRRQGRRYLKAANQTTTGRPPHASEASRQLVCRQIQQCVGRGRLLWCELAYTQGRDRPKVIQWGGTRGTARPARLHLVQVALQLFNERPPRAARRRRPERRRRRRALAARWARHGRRARRAAARRAARRRRRRGREGRRGVAVAPGAPLRPRCSARGGAAVLQGQRRRAPAQHARRLLERWCRPAAPAGG